MRKETIEEGQVFIRVCRSTQGLFDEWLNSLEEGDLETHFERLVQARDHLNCAIEEVGKVLDLESKK